MADPREAGTCRYSPSHLAWLGVLLFSCHMGSREELDRQRSDAGFAAALNWLAGTTEETASCADNLAAFLERLDPLELEAVCAWVTGQLIRSKALDRFRLFGRFLDQGVMRTCRLNGWEYIVTFKEGRAPCLFAKAMAKVERAGKSFTERGKDGSRRTVRWAEKLVHAGNTCHAVFMDERSSDGKETAWAWCTSIRPKKADTIWEITKGGRLRWKIENETINTFVNGGYEMRHVYGGKGHALKNFFHLLQLAHAFNELVVRGDLLQKLTPKADGKGVAFRDVLMTARHFARCLLESLRNSTLGAIRAACESIGHIQLRFSSA